MPESPRAAASGMQAAEAQQERPPATDAPSPAQDVGAAVVAAGMGVSEPAGAAQAQIGRAEVAKAAATMAVQAAAGSTGRTAGSTASSGLMIDGFLVPPHVLQALQRLDLQELRLQAGSSSSARQPESALQDITAVLAPQLAAKPTTRQEDQGACLDPAALDRSSPQGGADAAGSPNSSGPFLSPPSSEALVPYSCGSPHLSHSSSSGRGRGSLAGYSSRGSSRSSGRHSSRSGGSGRSSGSGRSGRSGLGSATCHAAGTESESEEHVQGLEAAVAELSARSAANAAVISQLNTDIVSLSTTNEALRQRLQLLTGQLRHRDVEIDNLRTDVRRLRSLMAGPIDNQASKASSRGVDNRA